jgi:hypothetical protein
MNVYPRGYILGLRRLALRVDAADFVSEASGYTTATAYLAKHPKVRAVAALFQVPLNQVVQDLIRRGPLLTQRSS